MEGDGGSNMNAHPQTENVEPDSPWLITQIFSFIFFLISSYGWPCLLVGAVCGVLYSKYRPAINQWKQKREDEREAEIYHKNPDLLLAREMAIENARKKLQDQYESQSHDYAEKQRIREEQKKKEKIEAYDALQSGKGGRTLRSTETAEPAAKVQNRKSTFRPDYNPMLGGGGSGSYRPESRSNRSGG